MYSPRRPSKASFKDAFSLVLHWGTEFFSLSVTLI